MQIPCDLTLKGDGTKICATFADTGGGDHPEKRETYCPWCFVEWRAHQVSEQGVIEPNGTINRRLDGSQMAVVKCQFCGWISIFRGARPGEPMRCGMCLRGGALLCRPSKEMQEQIDAAWAEIRAEQIRSLGGEPKRKNSKT